MKDKYDVIVVGGGPAGLAAGISAAENGAKNVLILERNDVLGGILNQCIHNGFGLHHFKEEMTGPEYACRFIEQLSGYPAIEVLTGSMVLDISADRTVSAIHAEHGYMRLKANAVVLSMGCRERTRGAVGIPGTRAAGIFTAGAAQLYMNIEGFTVGKRVVILGSGDIGLIMARRLTLEGAKVLGVYEALPYSSGLTRNIVQCLEDYGIPLHLSHTVTDIQGDRRVEQVVIQKVDEQRRPVPGTEHVIDCDTLLLSVGLIPENELSRQAGLEISPRTNGPVVYENMETSIPGIFACGNVAHVHDLVDFVTAESLRAGKAAALYTPQKAQKVIQVQNGEGIGYAVPQKIRLGNVEKNVDIFFRPTAIYKASIDKTSIENPLKIEVKDGDTVIAAFKREHLAPGEMEKITLPKAFLEKAENAVLVVSVNSTEKMSGANVTFRTRRPDGVTELICIGCPKGCHLQVDEKNGYAVTGNDCSRGADYGKQEVTNPTRVITSTVCVSGGSISRVPVKTDKTIPKPKIFEAMKLLDNLEVKAPVKTGEVVVSDICGTGANFVATRNL
ncbi:MAG: FAD-dependent oxidoreductase [Spirochaetaceae bacterium]|jgi:CxxC motif-containing protein/NADPH-dependent 2,4-dienoyl-CoA reductase/sulfur reductase-like enzyme|nr:FAD-dependent oxidoreductase [Spirochaetaceae bacterium]